MIKLRLCCHGFAKAFFGDAKTFAPKAWPAPYGLGTDVCLADKLDGLRDKHAARGIENAGHCYDLACAEGGAGGSCVGKREGEGLMGLIQQPQAIRWPA